MEVLKKNVFLTALFVLLMLFTFGVAASAQTQADGVATVTASSLRMRSEPNTSCSTVMMLPRNTVVAVVSSSDGWYGVEYADKYGFVSADHVTYTTSADALKTYGIVLGSSVNVRADASTSAAKVMTVYKNGTVIVKGFKNGWYNISIAGKSGYVRSDYIALTNSNAATASSAAATPATTASSNGKIYSLNGATVDDLIAYAKSFLGTPYAYGGSSSNGFDCSGFTSYVFKHFGISLPHSATGQLSYGVAVNDRSQLQVGDLVFFRDTNYSTKAASHVGIYIGNSQFIHASSSVSGKYVRVNSLNESYHSSVYTVGRHLIG